MTGRSFGLKRIPAYRLAALSACLSSSKNAEAFRLMLRVDNGPEFIS